MNQPKIKEEKATPNSHSTAMRLSFASLIGKYNQSAEIHYVDKNIWITQKLIAELYGVTESVISPLLLLMDKDSWLDVADDNSCTRKYYNLQAIISIGFKIESETGDQFCKWATEIVKDRLLDTVPIEDLKYELRLLLGAAKICELNEQNKGRDIGNTINYFKDSAYIHVRNLYNFFAANTGNDAKVTQFTTQIFDVSLYTNTWKDALHTHVLHIKTSRNKPNNVIKGVHLNEMIPIFARDIEKLWQEWIDTTENIPFKIILICTLEKAKENAQNDCDNVEKILAKENVMGSSRSG